MSRNLVTGGLGYMGTNLVRYLLNKGEEVVVFDIVNDSPLIQDIKDDIKIVQGQVGNWGEVLNVVHDNDVDCIYHLGAMITVPAEANPWAAYDTNVICGPGRRKGLSAYPSLMIQESVNGKSVSLPVDKSSKLAFIYIKDVVNCLVKLKETDENKLKRRVYGIQGFSLSAGEMLEIVQKYVPNTNVKFLADEKAVKLIKEMPAKVNDARAREDWGWKAEYNCKKFYCQD